MADLKEVLTERKVMNPKQPSDSVSAKYSKWGGGTTAGVTTMSKAQEYSTPETVENMGPGYGVIGSMMNSTKGNL